MRPISPTERRHAADQLGVPPDAAPADVWSAFLRSLPAAGFLPAPPLCAAAAILSERSVPGATSAVADLDDEEPRAAVMAYCREFWELLPAVRRERWQALLDRTAGDPLLAARVQRLEAGVDLPDVSHEAGPPRPRDIVGMIQALFVLGPIERATRRRELLDALPPPAAGWEQAVRHVLCYQPAHAALEPTLVERLLNWSRRPKAPARGVAKPAATWGFQMQGGLTMPKIKRPARAASGRGSPGWILILVGITLIRALGSCSSTTREPVNPSVPRVTIPSTPHRFVPPNPKQFQPNPNDPSVRFEPPTTVVRPELKDYPLPKPSAPEPKNSGRPP